VISIADNNFHHYVGTYERDGNMRIYKDGVLCSTIDISSYSAINFINTKGVTIGQYDGWEIQGETDEVMIFDKALNQTEITDIYNNQSSRFKSLGTVVMNRINVTGYDVNQIEINLSTETNFNTTIEVSLGTCIGINCTDFVYSEYQNVSDNHFLLDNETNFISTKFRLNSNGFYTPIIYNDMNFELTLLANNVIIIDYSDFMVGNTVEDVCYKLSNQTLTCLNNTIVTDYSNFVTGESYPDNICFKLANDYNLCFNKNGVMNE
jgi:hypothetical protein